MPCCGACCSRQSNISDPEVPRCEVTLEEAGEYSLKLAVRLPRYGFFPPTHWRRGEEVQLLVRTLGGPDGDIKGPKKDLISCRCGGKVVHQVNELLPDTRYTVEVSIVDDAMPLKSAPSSLEVRTGPATTCQFAEEDWGQGFKKEGANSDAKKGDRSARITSPRRSETVPRGRSHVGPSMTLNEPAAVPRSVSGADDSTIAPSDVDGADLQERNEEWDFAAEEVCRERVVEDDAQVEEIMPVTGRGIQCNLCSFMDCFRLMRQAEPESNEMLFGHEVATEAVSIAANLPNETREPRPRRQRPPFPGVPVDPASVGLELLPVLNESQLQHVFETRTRASRAVEN